MYKVIRDKYGNACAISDGDDIVLFLEPSSLNEQNVERIVHYLNNVSVRINHRDDVLCPRQGVSHDPTPNP